MRRGPEPSCFDMKMGDVPPLDFLQTENRLLTNATTANTGQRIRNLLKISSRLMCRKAGVSRIYLQLKFTWLASQGKDPYIVAGAVPSRLV